jgi:peptidoglycan/LPS O-acetylase OafA/YrhL
MPTAMAVKTVRESSALSEALSGRILSLDGLRAVAVLLVIFNHLGVPHAPEGRGVLIFFVLSGFLITWTLLRESESCGMYLFAIFISGAACAFSQLFTSSRSYTLPSLG